MPSLWSILDATWSELDPIFDHFALKLDGNCHQKRILIQKKASRELPRPFQIVIFLNFSTSMPKFPLIFDPSGPQFHTNLTTLFHNMYCSKVAAGFSLAVPPYCTGHTPTPPRRLTVGAPFALRKVSASQVGNFLDFDVTLE